MPPYNVPELSLIVLIGPSGSGKSTFARKHFRPTEVLSSDYFRGLVSDDENDQGATPDAFDTLHYVAAKRLAAGRLTVIDATNVQPESRQPLVALARRYHVLPVAIVLHMSEGLCEERNAQRSDRQFGPHVVRQQRTQLKRSLGKLKREGFRQVLVLDSPERVESLTIARVPLWNNRREEHGPFDFIGDVHGCCDELEQLLQALGYIRTERTDIGPGWSPLNYSHPAGRKAVFVGDLVDRGPRILDTVSLVRNMIEGSSALCVPGNHDMKLLRHLRGKQVAVTHGLAQSLDELAGLSDTVRATFCEDLARFLDSLISHYVLDDGKICVAHAGIKESMQGRGSGQVREFALYGETTGETDEFGLPVRHNWANDYRGRAMVVYGHTPVPVPDWLNNTINIDTGCVFGGALTALRYPEREFVRIPARRTYCEPARPFLPASDSATGLTTQQAHDNLLDLADVTGKRLLSTRLRQTVMIREENSVAALEVMSRFAVDPKWLIYLPPTMSPSETSSQDGFLEHPAEAFAYFEQAGVKQVICEEKHMGSRAVVVVCRDQEAARRRFGVTRESGMIYTRTGRPFFDDTSLMTAFLERIRQALSNAALWDELQSDWFLFDCELMPWSAKAQQLIQSQYAAVGAAALAALPASRAALQRALSRLAGEESETLTTVLESFQRREWNMNRFIKSYRHYCWPVQSLDDYKLAPFHILASEATVHAHRDHRWHMETIAQLCAHDPQILLATPCRIVELARSADVEQAIDWWQQLTETGGEGMVIKPLEFIAMGEKGLIQPAVKCRGREYLRIIYGADYTEPHHLNRLRNRGLAAKRSLALREFALGIESLERFVRQEPLRRVHECVFGVLALESEPVDPRL